MLGALLVDVELASTRRIEADHCGTCTRCLDACPTDAFDGPYQLDARRCISYWTIEHKGPIPDAIADRLDGWVFGCDVCQDVCPWNRKAPPGREPALDAQPGLDQPRPDRLARRATRPTFARSLKGTALARAKRSGLLRNAALILGDAAGGRGRPGAGRPARRRRPGRPRRRRPGRSGGSARPRRSAALRRASDDADPEARAAIARAIERIDVGPGSVDRDVRSGRDRVAVVGAWASAVGRGRRCDRRPGCR